MPSTHSYEESSKQIETFIFIGIRKESKYNLSVMVKCEKCLLSLVKRMASNTVGVCMEQVIIKFLAKEGVKPADICIWFQAQYGDDCDETLSTVRHLNGVNILKAIHLWMLIQVVWWSAHRNCLWEHSAWVTPDPEKWRITRHKLVEKKSFYGNY